MNSNIAVIEHIIEDAYNNKDSEKLKLLQQIITEKILSIKDEKNRSLDDIVFNNTIDILSQRLMDFCRNEISDKNFKLRPLHNSIQKYKEKNRSILYVYDALNIDKYEFNKYKQGVGDTTINILENALNKYGLSMDNRLSKEQLEELEKRTIFNSIKNKDSLDNQQIDKIINLKRELENVKIDLMVKNQEISELKRKIMYFENKEHELDKYRELYNNKDTIYKYAEEILKLTR